jgi:hypothetical protein
LQLTSHADFVHTGEPLAAIAQTVPHLPQFEASESSFTQAPLHGEKPVTQPSPQPVAPHVAAPLLGGAGQVTPQAPQLLGSVLTSTHDPAQFLELPGQFVTQLPPEQTSVAAQA